MIRLRDEVLVAYADGELSEEMRRVVERVLDSDAQTRKSVALFRETARCARRAYAGIDFTGVPAWLDKPRTRAHVGRPRFGYLARQPSLQRLKLTMALAACLLIGFGVGVLVEASADVPISPGAMGEATRAGTRAAATDQVSRREAPRYAWGRLRAIEAGSIEERFGEACRAFELLPGSDRQLPLQIVVACPGDARQEAAEDGQGKRASVSTIDGKYAPAEEAYPDSVSALPGTQQRKSASDRKIIAP